MTSAITPGYWYAPTQSYTYNQNQNDLLFNSSIQTVHISLVSILLNCYYCFYLFLISLFKITNRNLILKKGNLKKKNKPQKL